MAHTSHSQLSLARVSILPKLWSPSPRSPLDLFLLCLRDHDHRLIRLLFLSILWTPKCAISVGSAHVFLQKHNHRLIMDFCQFLSNVSLGAGLLYFLEFLNVSFLWVLPLSSVFCAMPLCVAAWFCDLPNAISECVLRLCDLRIRTPNVVYACAICECELRMCASSLSAQSCSALL